VTARPWDVTDGLWELIEPLLPPAQQPSEQPSQQQPSHPGGRRRSGDREALSGILFVLYTGIAWRRLPPELGFGSGATCRRRRDAWEQAGVWDRLYALLLATREQAGETRWSPAAVNGNHGQLRNATPKRARAQRTGAKPARSTISSPLTPGTRSRSRSPAV
jgi:transposase